MKLMYDLMHLAFRLDLTRVCTYMIAKDGSDRVYRDIGYFVGSASGTYSFDEGRTRAQS